MMSSTAGSPVFAAGGPQLCCCEAGIPGFPILGMTLFPVGWAGGTWVFGEKSELEVDPGAEYLLVLATATEVLVFATATEVVGLGEPLVIRKEEMLMMLDTSPSSIVVALSPGGFLCLDEPWVPLWVVGTLQPPVVGMVLSFATRTPPVVRTARPLALRFSGDTHVSLDASLFSVAVALPPGGFLCLDQPRAHL